MVSHTAAHQDKRTDSIIFAGVLKRPLIQTAAFLGGEASAVRTNQQPAIATLGAKTAGRVWNFLRDPICTGLFVLLFAAFSLAGHSVENRLRRSPLTLTSENLCISRKITYIQFMWVIMRHPRML